MLADDLNLPHRSPEELQHAVALAVNAAEAIAISHARNDPEAFLEYVMRDEETGAPIRLQDFHREWQRLITQHKRAIIWSAVETGKTQAISIARALWELGRNPALRILIVSNTDGQAKKIIATIARYIEQSAELRLVFPELRKSTRKADEWTSHALFVDRPHISKDPSVQSCGVHGNVLGSRVDLLFGDDVLDYEIAASAHQREELIRWWKATIGGRITRNGREYLVGTAWHRDDLMHDFARANAGWICVRYPVITIDPKTGDERSSWPERWPLERIRERTTYLGPIEAARQLKCVARSDEEARFKRAWIDAALDRGRARAPAHALATVPPGYYTITGVDLGVSRKKKSDLTVITTVVIHPNEDREVLDIQSGRWAADETIGRLIDTHHRYHSIAVVEDNAAQDFLIQITKKVSAVPIKPFTTGNNKHHPEFGVESIAAELASGKWIFPCLGGVPAETQKLIDALLYYSPTGHTPDHLMSLWFAREGARSARPRKRTATLHLLNR
jgi:hypothetical protein